MFSFEGKFTKLMARCFDCMVLSVLMILFSLPVVTAGAAASAAYYTVNKVFFRGEGHICREFWRSFRGSFRQATAVWLVMLLLLTAISGNLYFAMQNAGFRSIYFWIFCILAAVEFIWLQYVFPCIARFENKTAAMLKNVLLMSVMNPLSSLGLLLLLAVSAAVLLAAFPLSLILVPGLHTVGVNRIVEEVFKKYDHAGVL